MKKLMILVSCFALIFVLSNVSFAQDADVAEPAAPCSCSQCQCAAAPSALPFAYPPCPCPPYHKAFGTRLATLVARRHALPFAAPYPEVAMGPVTAPVAPYPYGISDLKPRAIRRAARLAPRPQPYPVPVPVAVAAPPALPAPDPAVPGYAPIVQTGRRNLQRNGDAPVINFMSIVRTPRDPFAGYYPYYPMPAQPQQ
jgi:hypothetical protein